MGLFSINIRKLPHGQELDILQNQVWFPDIDSRNTRGSLTPKSAGEHARILGQPGIKSLLDKVRAEDDTEAVVFEVNKTVKGPYAKIASERPGIVARTSETTFDVHLPVSARLFDIGSVAVQEVRFGTVFAQEHEARGQHLGQLAVARAIKAFVTTPQHNEINY